MHFLNVVPKIALVAFFFKFPFLIQLPVISKLLIISALLSFLLGALGGVFQKRIKRLLAYSAINNNGFFLLTVLVGHTYGLMLLLFFLVAYVLTLVGTFSSLQAITLKSDKAFELTNI